MTDTTSSLVNALYADVVQSLVPYVDNFVLLPSPGVLTYSFNIAGGTGDTVKVPITNLWTPGATISEGANVLATDRYFDPGSVSLTVVKRGAGATVTEEALEDGGLASVRNATLLRLSRAIAQATDVAGFRELAVGGTTIANTAQAGMLGNDGATDLANITSADISFVMSPDAMAYCVKRDATVKMFNDVAFDRYQMAATMRNGFKRLPIVNENGSNSTTFLARALIGQGNIALETNTIGLDNVSRAVANLRAINAPTDAAGFYLSVVSPAHEYQLASALNGVGATANGSIGSIAQDLANQALLEGMIGQAIGCRFIRSNNVPRGLAAS
jgi:hypothetical protein